MKYEGPALLSSQREVSSGMSVEPLSSQREVSSGMSVELQASSFPKI